MTKKILFLMLFAFLFSGAVTADDAEVEALNLMFFFQNRNVDDRMDIFNVDLEYKEESITLKGEVSSFDLVGQLAAKMEEKFPEKKIINETELVSGIGYGLVGEKVIDVKANPGGESIVTQLIFGDPVHVLEEEGGWLRIQGPDLYLGWVEADGIFPMEDEELIQWREGDFYLIKEEKANLYPGPEKKEQPLSEMLHGTRLNIIGEEGKWSRVFLPGDSEGWVETDVLAEIKKPGEASKENIIAVAKKYLGSPYVWAGTHIEGADCSGFIQRVLAINGIFYPRDSDQQYRFSENIAREEMVRGDLVFFQTYRAGPSHLGIYLGDGEFIHAGSGAERVIIESLDPDSDNYNPRLDNSFLGAARITENFEFLAPWAQSGADL